MQDFRARLSDDLKTAMRSRDERTRETIRMLNTALKYAEIAAMHPLNEGEAEAVLIAQIKQRRDAAEQFRAAGRTDLADKEDAELAILSAYLPPAPSPEEVDMAIRDAIAATGAAGPQDMGRVMRAVLDRYPGRVDGKQIAAEVRQALAERS
jgi:uncharacterized protein YqeY